MLRPEKKTARLLDAGLRTVRPGRSHPGPGQGLIAGLLDHLGPDPAQNIHIIVSRAPGLLNSRSAAYQRLDPKEGLFATAAACNLPPGFAPEAAMASPLWSIFSPTHGCPAQAAERKTSKTDQTQSGSTLSHGLKSSLSMPVFKGRRPLGALSVFDDRKRSYTPQEVFRLAALSRLLAIEEERLGREKEHRRQLSAEKMEAERKADALTRDNRLLSDQSETHRRTIATLRKRELELEAKNRELLELNRALETLRRTQADELHRLEEQALGGLREAVEPLIVKLKGAKGLTEEQLGWVRSIEQQLIEAAAPFAMHLTPQYRKLTPSEIKVAVLIRQDHTNKQIGQMLGISSRTVEVHRNNIRKKLGIRKRGVNLKTHLHYLTSQAPREQRS